MAFIDQATLAIDPTFQARCRVAALKAATNVAAEGWDSGTVSYSRYAMRRHLAPSILTQPSAHQETWAWAVAAQPAINAASTDADIEFTINSLWNHYAGVLEEPE
jgi:hypothetical protein